MGRQRTLVLALALLALCVGVAAAVVEFAAIGAAPCDPTAPVLSDGTRQAPGGWGAAFAASAFVSAGSFGVAVWLAMLLRSAKPWSKRRRVWLAVGSGVVALAILWVAGAGSWQSQCPA